MVDGGRSRDQSAEAVADHADLAGLSGGGAGSGNVGQDLLEVERAAGDVAADGDVVFGVAELDARPLAVEDRRGDGEVAGRCVSIGHRTDVAVDAEDLLDDDDAPMSGALGLGTVGRQLEPIGRRQ